MVILWRIPGTSMYRNMKQETSGAFVPGVLILRIGASMYFANAAYIKETVLQYEKDLREFNPVEYVVLEMTAVVTLDSTAIQVIQDIVAHFRSCWCVSPFPDCEHLDVVGRVFNVQCTSVRLVP